VFPVVPPSRPSARGWLVAKLSMPDALPADDTAFAVLPPPQIKRVLLVTRGNFFLEKLLAADELTRFELLAPEAFQLSMAASFDAVIFDNAMPAGFELGTASGNFLFLDQSPFAQGAEELVSPLITGTADSSPLLRLVNLQNVTVLRARRLAVPEQPGNWRFETPLKSEDHPLAITGSRRTERGEQRMAALAFDVAKSDLPLRIAFPLLISNTLQWLAGEDVAQAASVRSGEVITLDPDQQISTTPVTAMNGAEPQTSTAGVFRPLENGFYITRKEKRTSAVAVNTFSAAESDLGATSEPPASTGIGWPVSFSSFGARPPWVYLALAAFALFTLEWWLFHGRRTE